MAKTFVGFEWQGMEGMEGDPIQDHRKLETLSSIAWREVRNMWKKEMEESPKVSMFNEIYSRPRV